MEANKEKRSDYLEAIKTIAADKLVYVDESGIEMNITQDKGWGKKGKILKATKSGKYYQRTNIIAGLVGGKKLIAPFVFNGTCNIELFDSWVERFLTRELKKEQVVILDNAAFHKSKRTKELIESVGCKVIFLPPYSPDLNPIEKFWANMKRYLKQQMSFSHDLYHAISAFLAVP